MLLKVLVRRTATILYSTQKEGTALPRCFSIYLPNLLFVGISYILKTIHTLIAWLSRYSLVNSKELS